MLCQTCESFLLSWLGSARCLGAVKTFYQHVYFISKPSLPSLSVTLCYFKMIQLCVWFKTKTKTFGGHILWSWYIVCMFSMKMETPKYNCLKGFCVSSSWKPRYYIILYIIWNKNIHAQSLWNPFPVLKPISHRLQLGEMGLESLSFGNSSPPPTHVLFTTFKLPPNCKIFHFMTIDNPSLGHWTIGFMKNRRMKISGGFNQKECGENTQNANFHWLEICRLLYEVL